MTTTTLRSPGASSDRSSPLPQRPDATRSTDAAVPGARQPWSTR